MTDRPLDTKLSYLFSCETMSAEDQTCRQLLITRLGHANFLTYFVYCMVVQAVTIIAKTYIKNLNKNSGFYIFT